MSDSPSTNGFNGRDRAGRFLTGNSGGPGNPSDDPLQHPRSAVIATYALCGFANLGTIGIQLGGMAVLAPERSKDVAAIAFKAMLGGTLASWLAGTIAGAFV
jgi:hypothetical protein